MRKVKYLLIGLVFIILVGCTKNSEVNVLENNNFLSGGEQELLNLTGETYWSKQDLENFKEELKNKLISLTGEVTWKDINEIARYYDYLGYPGKAIVVYENWLKSGGRDPLAIHHNLAGLYKKLCKNDLSSKNYSAVKYCKKAIKEYYYLINKYKKLAWYKDIVETLIYLGDNERAAKVYNIYLNKGGKRDKLLEKMIDPGVNR